MWYHAIRPYKLRHVRHFYLRFWKLGRSRKPVRVTDFVVEFDKRNKSTILRPVVDYYYEIENESTGEKMKCTFAPYLYATLSNMVASPGIGNFTKDDLDRFVGRKAHECGSAN